MENFNTLVSGGFEPEDLVNDGWTDIIGKLLVRMRNADITDMSPGGLAKTVELADFEKMESDPVARRHDRQRPGRRPRR